MDRLIFSKDSTTLYFKALFQQCTGFSVRPVFSEITDTHLNQQEI